METKELLVFQKAHQFAVKIYKLTNRFPKSEIYGVVSQIRRAATSVPANIIEGNSRNSRKEFIQFVYTAKASLVEVNYFLMLSKDLGYLDKRLYEKFIVDSDEIGKMLSGLLNYLRNLISKI